MWNKYYIAANLNDALDLLAAAPDETKIVAGATDLMLEIERGPRKDITSLIDISRIPGLDSIQVDETGTIHIGALVTHNQVATSRMIRDTALCLAEAAFQIGSPQIRNRGTIAGNLITASPANDTIPTLFVLGAEAVLISKDGERLVRLEDLYTGVRRTIIRKSEILKEILLPKWDGETRSSFYKFALRNAQAISLVNAAVSVQIERGLIKNILIAVGAVAPTVIRLKALESTLRGKRLEDWKDADFSLIEKEIAPISDIRSSDRFRVELVRVVVKHCLEELEQNNETNQILPINPVTLAGVDTNANRTFEKTCLVDEQNPIKTRVNGKEFTFINSNRKSLLDLIREDAGLTGTKEGCAEGECGACTVHLDGKAVMACLVPAPRAHQAEITTIEGISDNERLHPVQKAFISEGAVQCGYCSPGFIMSAVKLLEEHPHPDVGAIKESITGNLCRCTGYYKIIQAIEKAANGGWE